jgi:hypothetical protein
MASSHAEQVLDLARALYRRGAIPEALAIVREVFVSLADDDDFNQLLPEWFRSVSPPETDWRHTAAAPVLITAIDWLGPALDRAGGIRALTNICTVRPEMGAGLAEHALRSWQRPPRGYRFDFPIKLESPRLGWECSSPILAAVRRQGIVVPMELTSQIVMRAPMRDPIRLSSADLDLVNAYARDIHDSGFTQPAVRLALASAASSHTPVPMTRVIEVVRPDEQVQAAAELFESRGYPTEAIGVLIDALESHADAASALEELWNQVQRIGRRGTRAKPPQPREDAAAPPPAPAAAAPPPPAPAAAEPPGPTRRTSSTPPDKSFFFLLKGDHAYRNQVVRGTSVNLHFLYDVPSPDALAKLAGSTLDRLKAAAKKGRPLEIGVFVKPVGFTFADDEMDYKIAKIEDDELTNDVCFELNTPADVVLGSGITSVLTYNGAEVFQAFIPIAIVEAIDEADTGITELVISRSTFELNDSLPRALTAFITKDVYKNECRVSVRVGAALPKQPRMADLPALKVAVDNARTALTDVANLEVFRTLEPGRWGPKPGEEPEFIGAVAKMMSTGSKLHEFLAGSPGTSELVAEIDKLEPGSKISIFTDSAFVPWEIVFPGYFLSTERTVSPQALPKGYAPERLWGNRFEFETVLVYSDLAENVGNLLPSARRQPGTLDIQIGVGATVEKAIGAKPAAASSAPSLNAIDHHRAYCTNNPDVAHWLDGSDEVKRAFESPDYKVSMLYLMCHGSSDGQEERLDFGSYKPDPHWLNPESLYPDWPVVFINSCSIGAISPHVFNTFLRRFREKHAFGIIASSFPLPTRFATLFGCEFLEAYRNGSRLGEALFELRRRLLKDSNPLAFFYAMQCPLDIQRPAMP